MPSYFTRAKDNGDRIESFIYRSLKIISNQFLTFYPRGIFDYSVDGVPFEVKSCQKFQKDKSHTNKTRSGRFILDNNQHDYLIKNNGYYVFVVQNGIYIKYKIIKSSEIKFKRLINWRDLFEANK